MLRGKVVFESWEPDKYPARVKQLLNNYSPQIGAQFQEEIRAVQFSWPTNPATGKAYQTKRKNGQTVGSPRDIVDTGNFASSQTPGKVVGNKNSGYSLTFQWKAAYALAIFLGYYNNRFEKQKARDWVSPALEKQPMLSFFVQNWIKSGK